MDLADSTSRVLSCEYRPTPRGNRKIAIPWGTIKSEEETMAGEIRLPDGRLILS
jgi:hypothetical protein